MKKLPKANPIQNPEIVYNLKEERSLHDEIDYTGGITAEERRELWEKSMGYNGN